MLNTRKVKKGNTLTVSLEGTLNAKTSPGFETELRHALGGVNELTLDFDKLDSISSAELRVLLSTYKLLYQRGGIRLIHVSEEVAYILELANLKEILQVSLKTDSFVPPAESPQEGTLVGTAQNEPSRQEASQPGILEKNHSIVEKVFHASLAAYIASMMAWAVGTLVDGAFIGNFLGVNAVAAYGMIWPVTLVFGLIGAILSGGSRNLYTKLAGQGMVDEANRVFTLACILSAAMSGVMLVIIYGFQNPIATALGANGEHAALHPLIRHYLTAFVLGLPFDSTAKILSGYMSMDSDNKRIIYATVSMTVADIVGDAAAIFVFHGGMFALGLATAIGQMVYFSVLSTHFTRKKRMLRFIFKGVCRETHRIGDIIISGAPAGTTRIASAIGSFVIYRILAAAAASTFIAAYSVHKSVCWLVSPLYFGVPEIVWTLSSIYYGEEDRKALDQLQRTALRTGLIINGITAAALFLFPRFFAGLYIGRENAEALTLGAEAVRLSALSVPFYLLAYLFNDYLMGVHQLKAANIYSFFLECGAVVPSVWVMVKLMGGRGSWFATPVALLLLCLVAYLYIRHWKHGEGFQAKRLLLADDFGTGDEKELTISATTMMEVVGMSNLVGVFCMENGVEKKKANALALCIEELGGNIIKHGFHDGKPHSIDIRILIKNDELILRIRDDCEPFNLLERYELTMCQQENDPGKNIGIRMVVNSCRDIQYLSTMNTNNLIIKI